MRLRRWATAGVSALVVLALSACGGLPTSSPVELGRRIDEPIVDAVRVSAIPPSPGDSQERIARGFLAAGADSDETHTIGKQFLAPGSVDRWRWTTEDVVVYDRSAGIRVTPLGDDGKPAPTAGSSPPKDATSVEVSVTGIGRLTAAGRYSDTPPTDIKVTFGMQKIGGEWRIVLPPKGFGLWLSTDSFADLYVDRRTFYVTPVNQRLIPDVRWYTSGSRLPTALARAQLDPVPAYLTGATISGVPAGTKLAVNSVPVDRGVATVDLDQHVLLADSVARAQLWAQLVQTLIQVNSVSGVSLTVEGSPPDLPRLLPGNEPIARSAEELGFANVVPPVFDTALVRSGTEVSRIEPLYLPNDLSKGRKTDPNAQTGDPVSIPEGWIDLVRSEDGVEVAAVGGDRKQLSRWRGPDSIIVPDFATDLSEPAYDREGYLWIGGVGTKSGRSSIFVMPTSSFKDDVRPVPIDAPWLEGRTVRSIDVAEDGARAMIISSLPDGSDQQLAVAGVVRRDGVPTGLAPGWRQAAQLTLMRDVVWLDSVSFAVLGRVGEKEPVRVWIGTVGAGLDAWRTGAASNDRLDEIAAGRRITTVRGQVGLLVTTDDGKVYARSGRGWRQLATATDVLVPGR